MTQKGINLKIIQQQSRHSDINTLLGYIQPTEEETKKEYLKGISLGEPKPYKIHKAEDLSATIQKSNTFDDKTDKYIALLQEGLMSADDFKKLITNNDKPYPTDYIY